MSDKSADGFEIPIDGVLDLHNFLPGDIKQLIPDYIDACLDRKITTLRIIHGKGKGVLRNIVHAILDKHPAVLSFKHESGSGGSWGATVVNLKSDK
jgi:DNA-nicking Smr family endonuclease